MWRINLKIMAVGLAVILLYTGIAHVIPQLHSEVPKAINLGANVSPEALAAAGEQIFNGAGGCTACHGLGTRAPNLLTGSDGQGPIGQRCTTRLGDRCKEYLFTSLANPTDSVVPGFQPIMPNMRQQLPGEEQLWALIAFLQSQGGTITVTPEDLASAKANAPAPTAAAPAAGGGATGTDARSVMQQMGCFTCHLIDGQGPPVGPPFDGIGGRISVDRIRRSILEPNADTAVGYAQFAGVMPLNFGERLTADQLEAIVRFLAARK